MSCYDVDVWRKSALHNICRSDFDRPNVKYKRTGLEMRTDDPNSFLHSVHRDCEYDDWAICGLNNADKSEVVYLRNFEGLHGLVIGAQLYKRREVLGYKSAECTKADQANSLGACEIVRHRQPSESCKSRYEHMNNTVDMASRCG